MISHTEENYLKSIFSIAEKEGKAASTNAIAAALNTTAASVTEMLKRLAEKKWIAYEKYKGVTLTESGNMLATFLIRKHRLWEVFLVDKLGFDWDEVHDLAEQLEHVQGEALISRLDNYLGNPRYDPHGDPIPDENGKWILRKQVLLSKLEPGSKGTITGVEDHSSRFLQYLNRQGLTIGTEISLLERFDFDQSMRVLVAESELVLSEKVGQNLFIKI